MEGEALSVHLTQHGEYVDVTLMCLVHKTDARVCDTRAFARGKCVLCEVMRGL
jgi:hypothetical protein